MADNDFTRRLRTAIKAKIQELGMEVDDELPDYIMIMIANKKDRTRMKTDLALFLGDHTDVFVDWMFDFFEKVNKKEAEEKASDLPPRIAEAAASSSTAARRSRSRSPIARSKSPKRSSRYDEEKPKRAPIRAPSRERERDSRRRRKERSPSPRRSREDRRKVTYDSDDDDDRKAVRSHVVAKNRHERDASPKLSSQVIVKRKKADPADVKGSSTLFKRAIDATVEDESPSKSRKRQRERDLDTGVLQVNTSRSIRRVVPAEEPEEETRFLVRVGEGPRRFVSTDDGPPGDENFAQIKRRRRVDNPVRAFLQLSGVRKALDATVGDYEDIIIRKRRGSAHGSGVSKQWDGKIEIDDEDDSDDDEAAIDEFLAHAHDSRIPPTEVMSRPIYAVPSKRAFNKAADPAAAAAGKTAERCRFWPNCRNEGSCPFAHPSKPCLAFPNCWFGDKCHFVHPKCKYEPNCTKPQCPYVHSAPRSLAPRHTFPKPNPSIVPGTEGDAVGTAAVPPTSAAEAAANGAPSAPTATNGAPETAATEVKAEQPDVPMESDESATSQQENGAPAAPKPEVKPDVMLAPVVPNAPPIRPLNTAAMSSIMCRFGARCHAENCGYRHPKKCRYDDACTNEMCYFWHPKKNAGRFRWVKT